ncbi:hypothetical protein QYF36_022508 [Acer negundo]|nr:hypothetical protein QYF36_022508 [Acer negundo]
MGGSQRLLTFFVAMSMFLTVVKCVVVQVKPSLKFCGPVVGLLMFGVCCLVMSCALEKQVCASLSEDYKSIDIAAKSTPVLGCSSVEMLEAQACLEGLQLAIDVGISGVILESDAARVIHLLSDHIISRTEVGAIIRNSLALGASVNLLSTEAVRRGANSVAHSLA